MKKLFPILFIIAIAAYFYLGKSDSSNSLEEKHILKNPIENSSVEDSLLLIQQERDAFIKDSLLLIEKEIERIAELEKYPNLIGKWKCYNTNYNSVLNSIVRIYQKDGVYYQSMVFDRDGSESNLKLKKISETRYDNVGKSDYNIINKNGDLEFWDNQGYFLTCKKVE